MNEMSGIEFVRLDIPVLSFNDILSNLMRKHRNFKSNVLIDNFPDLMLNRIERVTLGSNENNESEYEKEVWLMEEHIRLDYGITGQVILVTN